MPKNGLLNLAAVILHALGFMFYLYVLYNVEYPQVYTKGCMYVFMACMLLFLVIDEWQGIDNFKQLQFNTVNKCLFICNFITAACTIFNLFDGVYLMYFYLIAVIAASLIILQSGLQHDYFKDED